MAMRSLPLGYRFHPTDVELVLYYLKRKVLGKRLHFEVISEVNIYKFSPWDLPDKSCLKSKDQEWFFFCPRERKYASGSRVKRATENGYWKTTGKDRTICCSDKIVGSVKTLVFHLGHAPNGERTDWVIHEYMILDDNLAAAGVQDTYVLCKVFKKNGMGPKNGAQYGAPFNEADWADDDIDDGNHAISFASDGPVPAMPEQTEEQSFPLESILSPGITSWLPLHEEGPSPSVGGPTGEVVADEMDPSPSVGGPTGEVVADEMDPSPSVGGPTAEVVADEMDDEILSLLAPFTDESMLPSNENEISQGYISGNVDNIPLPCSDGCDIYNGLHDLGSWGQMFESRLDFSGLQNDEDLLTNMLSQDNTTYLELDDLLPPLDYPAGVARIDQLSHCEVLGTSNHENMQHLYSGASLAVIDQHASHVNEIPWLDVLQMVNPQICSDSASYNMDSIVGQLDNADYSANNMERGSQILNIYPRCNPAHRLPSAAEHLAHTFSSCGGSSIHIKAEVTHGAGECTNEALSVMMGGSCSCWCISDLFPKLLPLLVNCLPFFVAFRFDLIFSYCYSSETVSWSYHYYHHYYHPNKIQPHYLWPFIHHKW